MGALFWTEIRLHCSASIAAAVGTGAARGLRARRINTSKRFTVAAEFIKKGSGMCENQCGVPRCLVGAL
jgi:hypothetical protein